MFSDCEGNAMLKIWGRKNSSNVRKALWIAEEVGVPYETQDAGGAFGLVDEAAYRSKNPNGRIPMIEDGDFVLWESNAIVRYLAARHAPDSDLFPADVQARASADRWMDWTTSTIAAPFSPVFWGVVRTPPEKQDWPTIEQGIKTLHSLLLVADEALSRQPYLSGETFGMGDIPLGCFAYGWFEMPIERPPLPHLQAWYERLKTRPAYRKAVMSPLT
ncbi:Glutathione S-transferase protein [Pseudomonas syringae pv. delphinii]|uniref:Glutathione S-transferase protein n=5 Tax=Pseudomonas syringae group TaxID=136849 RepID=A0A3M4BF90_9PSED|nr:Glutathione S-transferase protein [Pseudomonas syringae pv. delphinii]